MPLGEERDVDGTVRGPGGGMRRGEEMGRDWRRGAREGGRSSESESGELHNLLCTANGVKLYSISG
jgi:hypothetical protein